MASLGRFGLAMIFYSSIRIFAFLMFFTVIKDDITFKIVDQENINPLRLVIQKNIVYLIGILDSVSSLLLIYISLNYVFLYPNYKKKFPIVEEGLYFNDDYNKLAPKLKNLLILVSILSTILFIFLVSILILLFDEIFDSKK